MYYCCHYYYRLIIITVTVIIIIIIIIKLICTGLCRMGAYKEFSQYITERCNMSLVSRILKRQKVFQRAENLPYRDGVRVIKISRNDQRDMQQGSKKTNVTQSSHKYKTKS